MAVTDPKRTLWYLKKIQLLSDLGPEVLARLAERVEMKEVRRREVVYLPGDPGKSVFFVNGGRVKICKVTRDGKSLTLGYCGPSEMFGETCLVGAGTTTIFCSAFNGSPPPVFVGCEFTVTVVDTTAPIVTEMPNPAILLWSPNKTLTPVTVSGVVTDATLVSVTYKVIDEYGQVQPSGTVTVGAGGAYSFIIKLEAYRNGNDADGRLYTIQVKATDAGGRSTTAVNYVRVPHNQ